MGVSSSLRIRNLMVNPGVEACANAQAVRVWILFKWFRFKRIREERDCALTALAPYMPRALIYLIAAALLIGAAPLPAAFYTVLRPAVAAVFAWAAYITYVRKHTSLPWILGIIALVFNPFIKIHPSKDVWAFINIASTILLLTTKKHFEQV